MNSDIAMMVEVEYNSHIERAGYPMIEVISILTDIQLKIEETKIDSPFGFKPINKTEAFMVGYQQVLILFNKKSIH